MGVVDVGVDPLRYRLASIRVLDKSHWDGASVVDHLKHEAMSLKPGILQEVCQKVCDRNIARCETTEDGANGLIIDHRGRVDSYSFYVDIRKDC
jgi:hypothetical protein